MTRWYSSASSELHRTISCVDGKECQGFYLQYSPVRMPNIDIDIGMENINSFTQVNFLNQKSYPKVRKLFQNENGVKTANNADSTIFTCITTQIPFFVSRSKHFLTLFTSFFAINSSFINNFFLKTVQNCDRERVFDKTAVV